MSYDVYVLSTDLRLDPDRSEAFFDDLERNGFLTKDEPKDVDNFCGPGNGSIMSLNPMSKTPEGEYQFFIDHAGYIDDNETRFLEVMARHFVDGSWIEWQTSEDVYFKWTFRNGKIIENLGRIVYDGPDITIEAEHD